jgi:hypothetical protein
VQLNLHADDPSVDIASVMYRADRFDTPQYEIIHALALSGIGLKVAQRA